MGPGIVTVDLHGRNTYQAKIAVDAALRRSAGVYRLRLIHGFHGGTALRDFIREEYSRHPKVKRLLYRFGSAGILGGTPCELH